MIGRHTEGVDAIGWESAVRVGVFEAADHAFKGGVQVLEPACVDKSVSGILEHGFKSTTYGTPIHRPLVSREPMQAALLSLFLFALRWTVGPLTCLLPFACRLPRG